ncbi:DUF3662 and FHA domain-containing protein [Pontimonas sp.]|uniref:DUF3662 and FHA domain-containing protein n=1 Tax=Pontimonas sp. TaxID=2304492 RepID=UPI0028706B3E|nr:DUF3662 and FHA domain-containing protein [Pontimonas sp.]MDR9396516.1 DUF3662 and FHA domain-containing protein [Pontimonas sp.]
MGFLDSFERSVERAVGGAFAKTFKSGVHPLEIASALKREMDSQAVIVNPQRMLVPRDYFVSLSEADYERLDALGASLRDELATELHHHQDQQGYYATGAPRVSLRIDRALGEGMVTASAVVSKEPLVWIPVLDVDGVRYPLVKRKTLVGRGSEADISLNARGVSRLHCEIRWSGKSAEVVDLGSTNGTEVDDVKVSHHLLPDRCILGVGQARIVVAVVPQLQKEYQGLVESGRGPQSEDAP